MEDSSSAVQPDYNAKATFFVVGRRGATYPSVVQEISDQGHAIGNHTWTHTRLTTLSSPQVRAELKQTQLFLSDYSGTGPCWRPPYGATNSNIDSIAAGLDMRKQLWNFDSLDWEGNGWLLTGNRVVSYVTSHPSGQVILMHDGGDNGENTAHAVRSVILPQLAAQRYTFAAIPACV